MYLFSIASFTSLLTGWCNHIISAHAWEENVLRGHDIVKLPLRYVIDHEELISRTVKERAISMSVLQTLFS